MLNAIALNQRDGRAASRVTCVEPFPSESLRNNKEVELVQKICQEVPLSLFDRLSTGDFLFIDCSHAVKVGSDVLRVYLEIIPRLPPGVTTHIHDVYLPYAYPRCIFDALLVAGNRIADGLTDQKSSAFDLNRPAANNKGLAVDPKLGHFPSSLRLRTT